jgi:hypothetical protein
VRAIISRDLTAHLTQEGFLRLGANAMT